MEKYTVISDTPIWIKQTPSPAGKNVGLAKKNMVIESTGTVDGYLRTEQGYIPLKQETLALVQPLILDDGKIVSKAKATPLVGAEEPDYNTMADREALNYPPTHTDLDGMKKIQQNPEADKAKSEATTNAAVKSTSSITQEHLDQLMAEDSIKRLIASPAGIYGMPYQWLPHVDPRVYGLKDGVMSIGDFSHLGRVYTEKIVAKMPLLIIAPGQPHYNATSNMSLYDILGREIKQGLEEVKSELNDNSGIFYSFEYATTQYFQYVNPILRVAARLLHIDQRTFTTAKGQTIKLDKMDWSQNYNPAVHGENPSSDWTTYLGSSVSHKEVDANEAIKTAAEKSYTGTRSIAFYVDSYFSSDDSISNSPRETELASKANSLRGTAADAAFLAGFVGTVAGKSYNIQGDVSRLIESFKENTTSRIFQNLASSANAIAVGGKMMFPKIWDDSDFSRNYSVKFKLISPEYDTYSWYINILVPLVHLLCLTLPQKSSNSFAYITPFLVRAFYKGMLNCDLGLVTSLSITRGQESGWTQYGLPTIIEVQMNIADLYDGLAMSKNDIGGFQGMFALLKNPLYMDFIANLCGVNLNEPDIRRIISFYKILTKGAIGDLPHVIQGKINQTIENLMLRTYGNWFNHG